MAGRYLKTNMHTKTYKVRIDLEQETTSPKQAAEDAVDYICNNHGDIVVLVTDPKGLLWCADLAFDGPALKVSVDAAPADSFTSSELTAFLEIARIGLAGRLGRDRLAAEMDLSDAELKRLAKKLEKFLNP